MNEIGFDNVWVGFTDWLGGRRTSGQLSTYENKLLDALCARWGSEDLVAMGCIQYGDDKRAFTKADENQTK